MSTPTPTPTSPVAISPPTAVGKVLLALAIAAAIGIGGYELHARLNPVVPPPPAPVPTPTPPAPKPVPPTPAPVTIEVPKDIRPDALVRLRLSAPVAESVWEILHGRDISLAIDHEDGAGSTVFAGPPGPYRASAWYLIDGHLRHTSAGLTIPGAPKPTPPTPTPDPPKPDPAPTPGPNPPPAPPKPPAPIPGDGLRVLIVYESADLGKYPRAQLTALYDQSLRDYLTSACVKVDGFAEWRIYDKDADMGNESKTWQAAMKRPHPELPWIVISDGKSGYEGKLPADATGIKALVQKYAGSN